MTLRSILIAIAACLSLAACEPTGSSSSNQTPGSAELARGFAAAIADGANQDVGRDLGGGVIVRGAAANGSTAQIDFGLPLPSSALVPALETQMQDIFRESFLIGLCEGPEMQVFFELGGTLVIQAFTSDGVRFTSFAINNCN